MFLVRRIAIARFLCMVSCVLMGKCLLAQSAVDKSRVDYEQQVKPILRGRCYACHGALKQAAGLRLDTAKSLRAGGESGPIVDLVRPAESELIRRVSSHDESERMPPEGDALTAKQIAVLQAWIKRGAEGPPQEKPEADPSQHWSFRAVERPAVPAIAWQDASDRNHNAIDAFVAAQHARLGLRPQVAASRLVLVRRLYLDLLGTPPSLRELNVSLSDRSVGWYQALVERLLADPRYGERWARHWMDIWRYSDWWGLGAQLRYSQKHIWHYRDWLIESLNNGVSYDEMIRQMLAADELYPNDLAKLRATGFLARNYFLFNRNQWMNETVEHVGKSLLGMTFNCARCHDHKYDPISQVDFFRMRAFFEPYHVRTDVIPGQVDVKQNGIPRVYDGWLDKPTYLFVRGQETSPDKSQVIPPGLPRLLAPLPLQVVPVKLPIEAWQPQRRAWVLAALRQQVRVRVARAKQTEAAIKTRLLNVGKAKVGKTKVGQTLMPGLAKAEIAVAEHDRLAALAAEAALEAKIKHMEFAAASLVPSSLASTAKAAPTKASQVAALRSAIRAERASKLAAAQAALSRAQLEVLQASTATKKAKQEALKKAQAAITAAKKLAGQPIKPDEIYTPLVGARWTATRFLFSSRDDPQPPYHPTSTGRRTALARWITHAGNPLAPRVAVNHIWQRHFGRPLVTSMFDFGRKNAEPEMRELVDWLAAEFVSSGWNVKHIHRLIVTSAVYRQGSSLVNRKANLLIDQDNRYWWRRPSIRLESQVIRDSILSFAGRLDTTQGGPPVPARRQADSARRSVYFFHSNNERNLFLTTFDEATVRECYRRETSIVPQQALALTNSRLVLGALEDMATALSVAATNGTGPNSSTPTDRKFAQHAFRWLLGIEPTQAEQQLVATAMKSWRAQAATESSATESSATESSATAPRLSPRAQLLWTLINHNDFVTVR